MTAPRIDVHWLTLDEPLHWRQACLASLDGAPIRLHVLPGIPGRIGLARAQGYAQGCLPLVSFVDPDDLYEASAFARLADALDACPQAVLAYTDEALIDEAGTPLAVRRQAYSRWQHAASASHVHGLIVMRRAAVLDLLGQVVDLHHAEWLLTLLVARRGACLHLPIVGRHWRQHPRQSHRVGDPEAVRRVHRVLASSTHSWRSSMPLIDPNLELNYGWTLGESGWDTGMDTNLKRLGALVGLSVKDRDLTDPPANPMEGDRYLVPLFATGAWAGRANQVAVCVAGTWEYHAPKTGWVCFVEDEERLAVFKSGGWSAGIAV